MRRTQPSQFPSILLALFIILFIWSAIQPKDYFLWFLEVVPAIVGIGLLILFYSRQPLTNITYFWCFVAASIMAVGAHYSYSEVPLFDLIKETFNTDRNNYDKVGHFVQGIVPVLISQEVFIRNGIIHSPRWINFLSLCVALSVAAVYELIEWFSIILSGDVFENFLGMQGYIWDAQSDILWALAGAMCVLLFSRRLHRAIA